MIEEGHLRVICREGFRVFRCVHGSGVVVRVMGCHSVIGDRKGGRMEMVVVGCISTIYLLSLDLGDSLEVT